jgi:phosphatidylserine synthase
LLSGLFRLARFNITHANQTIYFLGTPTTVAAITIAVLVLNVQHLPLNQLFVWWVFGLVVTLAILMISRVKFPTMKNIKKKWYAWLAFILIAFALIFGLMKLSLCVLCLYFLFSFEETIRIKFFLRPRV